jgi:hypothetical protein
MTISEFEALEAWVDAKIALAVTKIEIGDKSDDFYGYISTAEAHVEYTTDAIKAFLTESR